jgi:hypothetical protein
VSWNAQRLCCPSLRNRLGTQQSVPPPKQRQHEKIVVGEEDDDKESASGVPQNDIMELVDPWLTSLRSSKAVYDVPLKTTM